MQDRTDLQSNRYHLVTQQQIGSTQLRRGSGERNMAESYRIIPDSRRVETEVDIRKVRAAVLAHLFYEDQVEYSKRYLDRLPDGIDCIILSAKEEILAQFPSDRYIKIKKENRGRDIW